MGMKPIYGVVQPYPAEAVKAVDYTQTADVLYAVHINYAPRKVVRFNHTDWRWSTIAFGPLIAAPTGCSVAATTPNTTGYVAQTYKYKATAIKDSAPVQESRASSSFQVDNDLSLQGNYNTVTVPAPSGDVSRHVIYKEQGGVYGYIGATEGTTFKDNNIQPLLSETPPTGEDPFGADDSGDNPSSICFHQQRLFLGGTKNVINGTWASRSADPENMDRSRPARADDSLSYAILAEKVNAITNLTSLDELLQLTTDSIFAIQGGDNKVITPGDINPKRISGRGAKKVKPLVVDEVAFFAPSRSAGLRTLGFTFEIEGYKSNNVAIFAPHLFKGREIVKMVYQEEPFSCIWARLSDGVLLCFTWEAEQEVWGWAEMAIDGTVEDIETIPEQGYDRLYALIRRTIDETEHLFIERMALPHTTDITTACHLDCSVTQVFDPPQNVIRGLWHLEGATVSASYDGYVAHDLVVANGMIALPEGNTGSVVTVGLRYSGRIETLPAALTQGTQSNHVNRQQIGDAVVRTVDTRGIEIGAGGTLLEQVEPKDGDDATELMDVSAIDYRVPVPGNWQDTSTVVIEQNEPLPAHIIAIFATLIGSKT